MKKCGYIAVIGETNAGKSTLINRLVGQKVSMVSRKIQSTRVRSLGIAIYGDAQIILIDTPGFLRSYTKSAESLSKIAWDAFRETDSVLFVVDVNKSKLQGSIKLLQKIDANKKVVLVMNKVDLVHKPDLLKIAATFSEVRNFERVFMISSLTGSGVNDVLEYLSTVVPESDWIFSEDEITDMSLEKYAAEITREHLYHRIHREIPYKCTVETESCENEPDGSLKITQNIRVKSEAHKVICVGHKGGKIKAIGEAAREELSQLLERKVHLFLQVLVDEK